MTVRNESNWDQYYTNKDYDLPEFIVNALWKNYEASIRKHLDASITKIIVAELGGADSCFYELFKSAFSVAEYHIIDNNKVGLELFPHKEDSNTFLHDGDLLQGALPNGLTADIVFSGGLIEHFMPQDTRKIVEAHFKLTRPGGLVLMSFPTPTPVYWTFRRLLELIGKFPPLFERPLKEAEILPILTELGTPLENYKVWTTLLTQIVCLTRRSS